MGAFLESDEGQNLIWLDYCGYHLADNMMDLTPLQFVFLAKGRLELHEKMNSTDEDKSKWNFREKTRKDIFDE